MRQNIKQIIKEYLDNRDYFTDYVDYAQEKATKSSDYPRETKKIDQMKDKIEKQVGRAYKEVTGEEPVSDDNIVVKVDDKIKKGKIGSFKHPENKKDLGVLKVHPKALDDTEYIEDILKHELIHAAHGVEDDEARNHGGVFKKVATKIGLPRKYWH